MPVHHCTKDGRPGFKWGRHGNKCYTYTPGSKTSEAAALANVHKQAAAIEISKKNK